MGQMLRRMYELETEVAYHGRPTHREVMLKQFPDLSQLPPELGLLVLSHLNATDLCLAACVWQNLGNDEILWHRFLATCFFNFYPRDAMLARVFATATCLSVRLSVCLDVCHTPVLCLAERKQDREVYTV